MRRILDLDGKNEKTKKAQKRNYFANLCKQKTVDLRTSEMTDLVQQIIFCAVFRDKEIKVFQMKKSFEVSKDVSVPSPFPIAAHCSEREARVMVVVGGFRFPSFLFPFQLGFQNSSNVFHLETTPQVA